MAKRTALLVLLQGVCCSCGNSQGNSVGQGQGHDPREGIVGVYQYIGTGFVGEGVQPDAERCVDATQPARTFRQEIEIEKGEGEDVVVTLGSSTCSFSAHLEGMRVHASETECVLDPEGTLVRVYGVTARTSLAFDIDFSEGTFFNLVTDSPRFGGKYCGVETGFVFPKDSPTPTAHHGSLIVAARGTQQRCPELIVERASENCFRSEWMTGEYLVLDASVPDIVRGREVGVECTFIAERQADGTFSAASCDLDPERGLSQFGVIRKEFDDFKLDLEAKTLTYEAVETRYSGEEEFIRRYSTALQW